MPEDLRPLEPIESEIEVQEPDPIDDPQTLEQERERARIVVPNKLIMAIMLLILLLLLAAAMGKEINIFGIGESGDPVVPDEGRSVQMIERQFPENITPTLPGSGSEGNGIIVEGQGDGTPDGTVSEQVPVDPLFKPYWERHGAERIFGYAISPRMTLNGRQVQWFERARLEEWPEHAGTDDYIQSALIGREFTDNREFPKQTHFVSRPDMWYFPESGNALRGGFLQFWIANGGLRIFGYPISEEILEVLPGTGQIHTVQYFERARFEFHPNNPEPYRVMLGLLGRALYPETTRPDIIEDSILAPTPVPQS